MASAGRNVNNDSVSACTLHVRHRVCLRDRTATQPVLYLRCPHGQGPGGAECFDLVRGRDGVYGRCTLGPLPGARSPALRDPLRAEPWGPIAEISIDLFDRLALCAEPGAFGPETGWVPYVCVPEEIAGHPLQHIFDVGLVHSVSTWPLSDDGWGEAHNQSCPACGRSRDLVGGYDGHRLRIYCRCETSWFPRLANDEADAVTEGLRTSVLNWFPHRGPSEADALARMRECGRSEGWYPRVTALEEELLDASISARGAAVVLGADAALAAADSLNRALAIAERINKASDAYRAARRAARRG